MKNNKSFGHRVRDVQDAPSAPSPQWVSVKDGMPEEDTPVLIHAVHKPKYPAFGEATCIAQWGRISYGGSKIGNPRWNAWQYFNDDYDVTHWMPLPEPPDTKGETT